MCCRYKRSGRIEDWASARTSAFSVALSPLWWSTDSCGPDPCLEDSFCLERPEDSGLKGVGSPGDITLEPRATRVGLHLGDQAIGDPNPGKASVLLRRTASHLAACSPPLSFDPARCTAFLLSGTGSVPRLSTQFSAQFRWTTTASVTYEQRGVPVAHLSGLLGVPGVLEIRSDAWGWAALKHVAGDVVESPSKGWDRRIRHASGIVVRQAHGLGEVAAFCSHHCQIAARHVREQPSPTAATALRRVCDLSGLGERDSAMEDR